MVGPICVLNAADSTLVGAHPFTGVSKHICMPIRFVFSSDTRLFIGVLWPSKTPLHAVLTAVDDFDVSREATMSDYSFTPSPSKYGGW